MARVSLLLLVCGFFFFFKQKTAYEMRISDWSSDVCSSDLSMGNSLLHVAAQVNDAERILQLLELGANPNAANSRGDTFQVSLFLGSDARLNAAGRKSRQQSRDWLPEHWIPTQSPLRNTATSCAGMRPHHPEGQDHARNHA